MKYFILSPTTILVMIFSSCSGRSSGLEPKFYSADNSGKWEAQKATHVSKVEQIMKGDKLQIHVTVPLTTTPAHYIEAILIADANHKELSKKSLGKAESPEATLDAPHGYRDKLYVVIKCNLHDMWEVEIKSK